jgi:hypothetical protein
MALGAFVSLRSSRLKTSQSNLCTVLWFLNRRKEADKPVAIMEHWMFPPNALSSLLVVLALSLLLIQSNGWLCFIRVP